MARIRSVKPEFWADPDLARLSRDARLLYVGLWNIADEHARILGDFRYIKGQLFPYDDDLGPLDVDELLEELHKHGRVHRYSVAGNAYLFLPNLGRHQRLEPEKVASRLPAPEDADLSEPDPDPSARGSDKSARGSDTTRESAKQQVIPQRQTRADKSEPDADSSALLYVAGSRLQVAGLETCSPPAASSEQDPPRGFDEFWTAYPRKVGKQAARKAFDSAIKKQKADPGAIADAAEAFRETCRRSRQATKFIPHPSTWLNDGRYEDEPDESEQTELRLVSGGYQPWRNPSQDAYEEEWA